MSEAFWKSDKGIEARLEMLSEQVVWRTFNNAMKAYAGESGITTFEWVTQITANTCTYCYGQSGRHYRVGQFMPQLPYHPGCLCHWDVMIER